MSEECQGNPKKQTYLLECRPYVDYISKKVCIADPMQTMQTVFVTLAKQSLGKLVRVLQSMSTLFLFPVIPSPTHRDVVFGYRYRD